MNWMFKCTFELNVYTAKIALSVQLPICAELANT